MTTAVAVAALSLRFAGGSASLDGVGTLTATVRSGSASISGSTSADFEFLGARDCVPADGGETCTGAPLRVALRRRGTFDLRLRGTGIVATVGGSGTAVVDATGGTFRVRGGRQRALRPGERTLRY